MGVQCGEAGGGLGGGHGRYRDRQWPTGHERRRVVAAHVLGDHEHVGAVLADVEHGGQIEMPGRRHDAHAAHERLGIGGPHHGDAHRVPAGIRRTVDGQRPARRQGLHELVALCVQGLAHGDTSKSAPRLRPAGVPADPKTPVPSVCVGDAGSPSRPPLARVKRKPPRRRVEDVSRAGPNNHERRDESHEHT
jgi:hypothetical protein